MNDKIKELSQKIRQEGYEKGQAEAMQLLEDAKKAAEKIKQEAVTEAENILEKAREEADRYREKVILDTTLSVEQILQRLRSGIGDLLLTKVIDEPIESNMNNSEFVAKLIEDAVKNWKEFESVAKLEVLLPAGSFVEVTEQMNKNARKWLNNGIKLQELDGIKAGFEIQPHNGRYKISMTDEAFKLFLRENLRPIANKFLFEEE